MLRAKSFQRGLRAVNGAKRIIGANLATSAFLRTGASAARNFRIAVPVYGARQMTYRGMSSFKERYDGHVAERASLGIVPKALDAEQVTELVEMLKNPPKGQESFLLDLLVNRVPPGVDEAAYVKAAFLTAVTKGEASSPLVSKEYATELLGTMQVSTPSPPPSLLSPVTLTQHIISVYRAVTTSQPSSIYWMIKP